MSSLSLTFRDSSTMLRRNLNHQLRYISLAVLQFGVPIIMLLLFVYVFGGTLGDGLGGGTGGRDEYLNYVTPGVLLMAIAMGAQGTAIAVAMDMSEGIIARFRTMAIARSSVLTGHVLGSLIQIVAIVLAVLGVALLLGFETTAGPLEWLALLAVAAMVTFAIIWLAVAIGLAAPNVESASNLPMPLLLLPFLSSGFVPTDSMPTALRWFAEYQPFTPMIELLRGLLSGTPIGTTAWVTAAWCVGVTLVGYLWAKRSYAKER